MRLKDLTAMETDPGCYCSISDQVLEVEVNQLTQIKTFYATVLLNCLR